MIAAIGPQVGPPRRCHELNRKETTIQIALLCLLSPLALPQETPAEYKEVLKIVGKSGDYK